MSKTEVAPLPVNHKGQPCIVSPIFCQEGYCSECQIYRNWLRNRKTGGDTSKV